MGDKFIFMVILSRYCTTADESMGRDAIVGEGIPAKNTTSGEESQSLPVFQVNEDLWKYSCAYTTSLGRPHEVRGTQNDLNSSTLFMTREVQKELWEIDSWIKENKLEYLMVYRIMAIAFTTLVYKEMYQGKQRMQRWPIECDITRQERQNLDETINDQGEIIPNSLRAITDLVSLQVQKLQEYESNRQPGSPSVDDYFTDTCKKINRSSDPARYEIPFRFLEYMEHVTKLWEKDGDGFKYPAEQVQHYLDNLLIYRATLIYIYMSKSADNSHIISNPEYHKLIPVI
ncbi:hypothetical protein FPOAC1_007415 [Fusarium poae]|uniref:hypothetical protein n=1 Tax=Fusarium poae TaxID=36050 RepID=UPI001CE9C52E|nr:hypothetical protein FPOAC1_007415 [Fusarium poae]KAG8668053.1 hypothetical protein FPOAC1_007415 [Fusarium poae]